MTSKRLFVGLVVLGVGAGAFFAVGNEVVSVRAQPAPPFTVPHGNYSASTDLCRVCHDWHAPLDQDLLPEDQPLPTASPAIPFEQLLNKITEPDVCYSCHDGSGSSTNIETEFGTGQRASSHPVPDARDGYLLVCSDCHAEHQSPDENTKLLYRKTGPDTYEFSPPSDPIGNAFCYTCHGAGSTLPAPLDDHSAFESSIHNTSDAVEPSTPATGVKCTACHEPHASDFRYLTTASEEALCFTCHTQAEPNTANGSNPYRAFNGTPNDTTAADGNPIRIYHHPIATIEQAGGTRQVECDSCHNSHVATVSTQAVDPARGRAMDSAWSFGWDTASAFQTRGSNVTPYCTKCHINPLTTAPLNAGINVASDVRLVNDTSLDADGSVHDKFDVERFSNSAHGSPRYVAVDYIACPGDRPCSLACTACHDFHGSSNAYMLRENVISPDYRPYPVTDASYTPPGAPGAPGIATLTIGRHGLAADWSITVSGVNPPEYNGTFVVAAVTETTVSYALYPPSPPSPYGGGGQADPSGPEGQTYSSTVTGFGGLDTPSDRAKLQVWCLSCHLEQSYEHRSNQLCTRCHSHFINSPNPGGF